MRARDLTAPRPPAARAALIGAATPCALPDGAVSA